MSTADERVMAKLFAAERLPEPDGRKLARFLAWLEGEEAAHPVAAWLAEAGADLDWVENVCDFLSAYYGLPRRPLFPGEGEGWEEAAAALEARLKAAGLWPSGSGEEGRPS
ncbi:conserved protein of unknown function [Candidatus Hydrogenisulfobacillus filiaventi]|uniref:Uncharacterized protein n=1 Tax=Candidatus Hydrogenisulfobacillus filiaventi TaxID=2707344 RepID=A0A6F8ZJD6_9FIRM|nr:hypothetical protein [Bacillota bacterium]CAB1129700.1 conserved protein of unknown function [Candidatus Hydrogenisulfobacillus filiaventi]